MGYSYTFRIAVEDLENFEQMIPVMRIAYKTLVDRGWFPRFGVEGHSGSKGYGVGPIDDKPLSELVMFTSQFPEVIFTVFFFHWDNTNLSVYRIQGTNLLNTWTMENENIPFGKINLSIEMKNVDITNDISEDLEG